jgi:mRNA degradation ribonuclease J1/J2
VPPLRAASASIPATAPTWSNLIIKDRRHLSEDGIVLPIIAINKLSEKVETSFEIVTRDFNPKYDGRMEARNACSKIRSRIPAKKKKPTMA